MCWYFLMNLLHPEIQSTGQEHITKVQLRIHMSKNRVNKFYDK